ncbi:MAG: hypothetical protein M3345_04910 [Actinomycetota bacterium]|nr:hypothetical protein [Actinomycetota bacterium]
MGDKRVVLKGSSPHFEVCFICTGNRARSPVAQHTMSLATRTLPVVSRSVGLLDLGGAPALPEIEQAARDRGLDLSAHRSTCITSADLTSTDLVLGFELQHVASAVVDHRADPARTFTVPELVRLLEGAESAETDPIARAREVIATADGKRREQPRQRLEEVHDPIGEPGDVQRSIALQVHHMTLQLAEGLFGRSASLRSGGHAPV